MEPKIFLKLINGEVRQQSYNYSTKLNRDGFWALSQNLSITAHIVEFQCPHWFGFDP